MVQAKGRWQRADDNFRKQVKRFRAESGLSITQIAARCAVSTTAFYGYFNNPSRMTKKVERYLSMLFEEYGMRYDPTMGEGANVA